MNNEIFRTLMCIDSYIRYLDQTSMDSDTDQPRFQMIYRNMYLTISLLMSKSTHLILQRLNYEKY